LRKRIANDFSLQYVFATAICCALDLIAFLAQTIICATQLIAWLRQAQAAVRDHDLPSQVVGGYQHHDNLGNVVWTGWPPHRRTITLKLLGSRPIGC
jgi:hypothetical protein